MFANAYKINKRASDAIPTCGLSGSFVFAFSNAATARDTCKWLRRNKAMRANLFLCSYLVSNIVKLRSLLCMSYNIITKVFIASGSTESNDTDAEQEQ